MNELIEWIRNTRPNMDQALRMVLLNFPRLPSVYEEARKYLTLEGYQSIGEKMDAAIRMSMLANGGTGFATGLASFAGIPAAMILSWAIQVRLVAVIALMANSRLSDDKLVALVLEFDCLDDNREKKVALDGAVRSFARKVVDTSSPKAIEAVGKKSGVQATMKVGVKGMRNIARALPFLSALAFGIVDSWSCHSIGHKAKERFLLCRA